MATNQHQHQHQTQQQQHQQQQTHNNGDLDHLLDDLIIIGNDNIDYISPGTLFNQSNKNLNEIGNTNSNGSNTNNNNNNTNKDQAAAKARKSKFDIYLPNI